MRHHSHNQMMSNDEFIDSATDFTRVTRVQRRGSTDSLLKCLGELLSETFMGREPERPVSSFEARLRADYPTADYR